MTEGEQESTLTKTPGSRSHIFEAIAATIRRRTYSRLNCDSALIGGASSNSTLCESSLVIN